MFCKRFICPGNTGEMPILSTVRETQRSWELQFQRARLRSVCFGAYPIYRESSRSGNWQGITSDYPVTRVLPGYSAKVIRQRLRMPNLSGWFGGKLEMWFASPACDSARIGPARRREAIPSGIIYLYIIPLFAGFQRGL